MDSGKGRENGEKKEMKFGDILGGGNSNISYFHPYLGKIPILTNIFQMGWFNHQAALNKRDIFKDRDFCWILF